MEWMSINCMSEEDWKLYRILSNTETLIAVGQGDIWFCDQIHGMWISSDSTCNFPFKVAETFRATYENAKRVAFENGLTVFTKAKEASIFDFLKLICEAKELFK